MIERLMVSHPSSGFGIYLPEELEELLGGLDASVSVTKKELKNGRTKFLIVPDPKGKRFIRKNVRGTFSTRLYWSRESPVPPPIEYHFGKVWLPWDIEGEGVSFVFPRKGELKDPKTKTHGGKPKRKHMFGGV